MDIISDNEGLISNLELLAHLQDPDVRGRGRHQKHVDEVIKYLKSTPAKAQTLEEADKLLAKIERFKLTKAEKLQLFNVRPTTLVEIHLIVEECEERMTEEETQDLLELIYEHFGGIDGEEEGEAEAEAKNDGDDMDEEPTTTAPGNAMEDELVHADGAAASSPEPED
eukprot:GFYU01010567.1.p1 GENE.GFYU01010567.1~~GFYU01010567.1.p1  ORF type:complete len:168 (+),score=36.80 GFYU01010567.1:58-561(+)